MGSILVDFDGTACPVDVAGAVCQRFSADGWEAFDDDARSGRITLRAAIDGQTRLLRASREEMLDFVLKRYAVDHSFIQLESWARARGIAVTVVSDGFGFYIEPMLAKAGLGHVPVRANSLAGASAALQLEHPFAHAECIGCGTCKMRAVLDARAAGGAVAFVGDGESDRFGALFADFVFAKGRLAVICGVGAVDFLPWQDFDDVRNTLAAPRVAEDDAILGPAAPREPHADPARCPGWTLARADDRIAHQGAAGSARPAAAGELSDHCQRRGRTREQGRGRVSGLLETIATAVRDGDRDAASRGVAEALATDIPARAVLADGLVPGLRQLGELFKDGQAFLPEILISVRAMDAGLAVLQPSLAGDAPPSKGTVVLGTVEGDLHDIGKRLVGMLLRGNGFDVVDLGVDVSAATFAAAAAENEADIVALSALLTTTTPQFRRVIDALADAGRRERVLVMVGGAPVSRALADEVGADGFADDCILAVDEAERLLAARAGAGAPRHSDDVLPSGRGAAGGAP